MFEVVALLLCSMSLMTSEVAAAGAGRSFPSDSQTYVLERFQSLNSRLEWDQSNFLVDLAGQYATCRSAGTSGHITIDRQTPEGETIFGVVDNTNGPRGDVDSVTGYIRTVIDRWMNNRDYDEQIRNAQRFGCSICPACRGKAVVSCLFSPGYLEIFQPVLDEARSAQNVHVFSPQQYRLAEMFAGNNWNRSAALENLSAEETSCSMIDSRDWPFSKVQELSAKGPAKLSGVYGVTENENNAGLALTTILRKFKPIKNVKQLGCSVTDTCTHLSRTYVVASCIYQDN